MNYFLTETEQMIKDTAREVAQKYIKPVAAEYDEKNEFAWDVQEKIAESGLCGVYIPETYGGICPEGPSSFMDMTEPV